MIIALAQIDLALQVVRHRTLRQRRDRDRGPARLAPGRGRGLASPVAEPPLERALADHPVGAARRGALFHWLVKKEDLIVAMFTGVKRVPASLLRERRTGPRTTPPRRVASRESPQSAEFPSGWRSAALMALAAAIVLVIVRAASWAGYQ